MSEAAQSKITGYTINRLRFEPMPGFDPEVSFDYVWWHRVLRNEAYPRQAIYELRLTLGGAPGNPYVLETEFKAMFQLAAPLPADPGPLAFSEFFPALHPYVQKLVERILGEADYSCGQLPGISPDGAPGPNALGGSWTH